MKQRDDKNWYIEEKLLGQLMKGETISLSSLWLPQSLIPH